MEGLDNIKNMMQKDNLQRQVDYQKISQNISLLEQKAKQVMTKEAISRFGNIKTAHPDLALQLIIFINEQLKRKPLLIDDAQLKSILQSIQTQKPRLTIRKKE